ncbi:hypothetical protein LX36DRAFT_750732 [Colletotrichum falcatum]|nr:hypothetical protein LX36DRAFT_750732 [Colletotrichum falcatum]
MRGITSIHATLGLVLMVSLGLALVLPSGAVMERSNDVSAQTRRESLALDKTLHMRDDHDDDDDYYWRRSQDPGPPPPRPGNGDNGPRKRERDPPPPRPDGGDDGRRQRPQDPGPPPPPRPGNDDDGPRPPRRRNNDLHGGRFLEAERNEESE